MSYLPTEEERENLERFIKKLTEKLHRYFKENHVYVKLHVVGSTAKGTFVRGEYDVDIYVMTDKPQVAYELTRKLFPNGKRKMGELLIWHFIADSYDVDLVFAKPGWVKEDTLRHAPFYNMALPQEQKREVVKAKAFFKTKGVYGAEVGGITGVAVEELVRRNGNLNGLCKFLCKQHVKPFLQDPVMDEPRDLLASIVPKRWRQIQRFCREYLETERFSFQVFSREKFLNRYRDYMFVKVKRRFDKGTDFLTAASLCQHVKSHLLNWEPDVKCDFDVYLNGENIIVAVKVKPEKFSPTTERCVSKKFPLGVEGFKKTHPNCYEKNGYVCAVVKRKIVQPLKFFVATLKRRFKQRGYVVIP